ncbi:MAG: dockerin type I repeat-containing protein, partial [Muribaculaceae bacterium]|nr:dockerin type I repeat-containing protein [Muribaculaceae bacterium]
TGITDMSYTVKNLAEAGTFYFKVRANYIDGTQSRWSKSQKVTLFANGPEYEPGDANEDGKVDVNDVTTVINHILGKNPSPFNFNNANVNGDETVNVLDVTLIINIILHIL